MTAEEQFHCELRDALFDLAVKEARKRWPAASDYVIYKSALCSLKAAMLRASAVNNYQD